MNVEPSQIRLAFTLRSSTNLEQTAVPCAHFCVLLFIGRKRSWPTQMEILRMASLPPLPTMLLLLLLLLLLTSVAGFSCPRGMTSAETRALVTSPLAWKHDRREVSLAGNSSH